MAPTSFAHKRLPSAPPAIAVRATATPGLLAIAKKPTASPKIPRKRAQESQQQQQQQRPTAEKRGRKENVNARKQPQPRRSSSQHAAHSRTPHRQPSPPSMDHPMRNQDSSDSEQASTLSSSKSAPALNQPSGRLARSRRSKDKAAFPSNGETNTPRPTTPVTIPHRRVPSTPVRLHGQPISRSAPLVVGTATSGSNPFVESHNSPPVTPICSRPAGWQQSLFDNGPRTAPLSASTSSAFSFPNATSTPPRHKARQSYGDVFAFPFDEDMPQTNGSDLKSLLANMQLFGSPSQAQLDKLAYANSSFQNSPDPGELPPPSFFASEL